jgi:ribonuclease HII
MSVIPFAKDDQQIWSIATASFLAKVTRDRQMDKLAEDYHSMTGRTIKGMVHAATHYNVATSWSHFHHRLSFKPIKVLAS